MSKQVLFWMSIDKKDVKADGLFYKEKKIYKSLRLMCLVHDTRIIKLNVFLAFAMKLH